MRQAINKSLFLAKGDAADSPPFSHYDFFPVLPCQLPQKEEKVGVSQSLHLGGPQSALPCSFPNPSLADCFNLAALASNPASVSRKRIAPNELYMVQNFGVAILEGLLI